MEYRKEIDKLLREKDENKEKLEKLAYLLYKLEIGKTVQGLPVECSGYKKVLRLLGYVI